MQIELTKNGIDSSYLKTKIEVLFLNRGYKKNAKKIKLFLHFTHTQKKTFRFLDINQIFFLQRNKISEKKKKYIYEM